MTKPPSLALTAATIAGKICSLTVRSLGSGGEALPGLVAKRIDSTALRSFGRQCKDGIVLVCGTNGKTTVSRLIADFLTESGQPIVHNRSGSNMTRGHLAAFLEQADWLGRVHADLAILEVDEAVLPETLSQISPRIVLLHNLFRDQLDRYGEVDTIRRNWEAALRRHLAADAILTVNADDPNLAYLASQLDHRQTIYYGIDDQSLLTSNPDSAVDAYLSPVSGKPLQYTGYFYSHLGIYADPDSNFHRPQPDCRATAVRLAGSPTGSKCEISFKDCQIHCQLRIPGLYNVYNALAAVTVGLKLGVNERRIVTKLAGFSTVFGRFETIRIGRRDATFCLIKNPAGATEVLRTIGLRSEPFELAIMANDHFADGQDVSWYWDTPFEMIAPRINRLTCAGTRANEMALRLKYAGFASEPDIFRTEAEAFSKLLNSTSQTDLYVVSTYTATLNLQRILTKHRIKAAYWKE